MGFAAFRVFSHTTAKSDVIALTTPVEAYAFQTCCHAF